MLRTVQWRGVGVETYRDTVHFGVSMEGEIVHSMRYGGLEGHGGVKGYNLLVSVFCEAPPCGS